MSDLDEWLLEAAGRTGTGGRNQHSRPPARRQVHGSYSDGRESRDEADEKESGHGVSENGDNAYQEGDSGDESDIGSDLYKDEYDRQRLSELPELEREMILSERAARIDDKKLQEVVRSKWSNERKSHPKNETPVVSSRTVRSSARYADRAAAKDDALNELRAKRMKQQHPESHNILSPRKRKSFSSTSSSRSADEGSGSDDESTDDAGMVDSDDDVMVRPDTPTFADIKEITIRRSRLARWIMEPFFDDLIVGCFVRVGIGKSRSGPIYRLCVVRNVDASDPDRVYKLENRNMYKYLNCVWGSENSSARWQMAMVSDSPPVEEEFEQWMREVKRTGGRLPSKQDMSEKKEAIQRAGNFSYSAATVKQMLQEKKSAMPRPLNVAAEKERLRREMDIAESNHDDAEVERIKERIQQLEATRQAQAVDAKAMRLAEMNRKNKAENFRIASEAKRHNPSIKAGDEGYDPFSRRWTRSRNYYAKPGAEDDAAAVGSGAATQLEGATQTGVDATAAALVAAADAGKLVDTCAPVGETEWNSLHNFDLPISLAALQRFGGAQGAQRAFMARKQQIEATIGCRAPESDGRRHVQTLTVADYNRRRGLL